MENKNNPELQKNLDEEAKISQILDEMLEDTSEQEPVSFGFNARKHILALKEKKSLGAKSHQEILNIADEYLASENILDHLRKINSCGRGDNLERVRDIIVLQLIMTLIDQIELSDINPN